MKGIKLVLQRKEFIYETEKQRDEHVESMEEQGWKDMSGSSKRRVKDGANRLTAKEEEYEWFACFQINDKY